MNPNQALWEKGDFTSIAAFMRESGESLVRSLDVKPPLRALDLGCGDGTTALPLARIGAEVVGVDIARNLVEAGNRRAAEAGLDRLRFREGDASDLKGTPDHSFDLTLSMFGAMFAPRPFDVAREMVRVTKPGGRIVMGNWIAGDPTFISQLLKISQAYAPPPPEGFVSPMTWGIEDGVRERFGRAGVPADRIGAERSAWRFESRDQGPEQWADRLLRFYGPTMNAQEAAEAGGKGAEFRGKVEELARSHNTRRDGGFSIEATYLRVTVLP